MDKHYKISCRFHKLIKYDIDSQACFLDKGCIDKQLPKSMWCLTFIKIVRDKKKRKRKKFYKIPTDIASGFHHYLIVTLGSWVTPQVITALVPLMTLWSCGGLVMRVRAANTHRGCYSETVFEQQIDQSLLDLVSSHHHSMSFQNGVNHTVFPNRWRFL